MSRAFVTIAEMDKDLRVVSGTVTDINGNYTIEIKNTNELLHVSYIGYKTQNVEINNHTIIDFELETEAVGCEWQFFLAGLEISGSKSRILCLAY